MDRKTLFFCIKVEEHKIHPPIHRAVTADPLALQADTHTRLFWDQHREQTQQATSADRSGRSIMSFYAAEKAKSRLRGGKERFESGVREGWREADKLEGE